MNTKMHIDVTDAELAEVTRLMTAIPEEPGEVHAVMKYDPEEDREYEMMAIFREGRYEGVTASERSLFGLALTLLPRLARAERARRAARPAEPKTPLAEAEALPSVRIVCECGKSFDATWHVRDVIASRGAQPAERVVPSDEPRHAPDCDSYVEIFPPPPCSCGVAPSGSSTEVQTSDPLALDPEDGTLCGGCRAPRNAIHSPLCPIRTGTEVGRVLGIGYSQKNGGEQ